MMSGGPRLGHIEPRERVGAPRPVVSTNTNTSAQLARALNLCADGPKQVCVYCDWHDDYVVETWRPTHALCVSPG